MSQTYPATVTVFTEPTFALASYFPELDPVAILQVVEAPVVRLAFYEFLSRFWLPFKTSIPIGTSLGDIRLEIIEKAFTDFSKKPAGSRITNIGGGCCSSPDDYQVQDAFYAFMSRVYGWATQDYLSLPLRRQLEDRKIAADLIWGILGICLGLHEDGDFPEPLLPLPTGEFEFEHVDGVLEATHVEKWENGTRAMTYTPRSYLLWQEWRIRYEALNDQNERNRFALSWASNVPQDFKGPHSREIRDWLKIARAARLFRDTKTPGALLTAHCIFKY
ncbi:hypothetical protein F4803DRAFT_554428 [Xylaria telfairii]|nr:hypothetical protein F4803DRAFT_554428 [Xylaria telfairii]